MKRLLLICAMILAAGNAWGQQSNYPDATTATGAYLLGRDATTTKEYPISVILEYVDANLAGVGTIDADDLSDGTTNAIPTLTQETNWDTAYGWGDHSAAGYEADAHASEHETGGADALTLTLPWEPGLSAISPEAGDVYRLQAHRVTTLSAISCLVDPADTGESVVVDLKECDSDGDTCVSVLSATITCGNAETAGTVSDASIAADAVIEVSFGTVTGTVSGIEVNLEGTQQYAQ